MAFDKVIDSATLDAGMTATANAIRKKTGGTTPIEWDSSNGFKAAVEVIDTEGGVELPELDTPASDDEVFLGKEYIDESGQKRSGSFTIEDELTEQDDLISRIANALKNKSSANAPGSLPTLENPAAVADVASGKDFINADGDRVTGELTEIASGYAISASDNATVAGSTSTGIRIKAQANQGDYILRTGAYLMAAAPAEKFGDAAASDVAKGKTFTSSAGLLVEGTLETGGVHMSVDGETLVITGAVTIENETLIL